MLTRFIAILLIFVAVEAQSVLNSNPYSPTQSHRTFLNDAYVCTVFASYNLHGQVAQYSRPVSSFCQDSFRTGSCEKCCRMAAKIQGADSEADNIIGFNVVMKREPLCICCAPNTA